jgi:hypothetical protein
MLVPATLVQDQFGRTALTVGDERDLGIHYFEKVVTVALREYFEFRLARIISMPFVSANSVEHGLP